MINTSTIEQYEDSLLQIIYQQNKDWLNFGKKLSEIQAYKLYFQKNCTSFSAWLNRFSKKSGVGKTKLWKCLRVVKLLQNIEMSADNVATQSTNGLAEIARIYEITKCEVQARSLINDLVNKNIRIQDLKKLVKSLKVDAENNNNSHHDLELNNDTKTIHNGYVTNNTAQDHLSGIQANISRKFNITLAIAALITFVAVVLIVTN